MPSDVFQDIELKIYVDGELFDVRTVNPSTSAYIKAKFTGTGKASLVIRLNDREYITAEIDYAAESVNVISQKEFVIATPSPTPTAVPTAAPTAEPTPEPAGGGEGTGGEVTPH